MATPFAVSENATTIFLTWPKINADGQLPSSKPSTSERSIIRAQNRPLFSETTSWKLVSCSLPMLQEMLPEDGEHIDSYTLLVQLNHSIFCSKPAPNSLSKDSLPFGNGCVPHLDYRTMGMGAYTKDSDGDLCVMTFAEVYCFCGEGPLRLWEELNPTSILGAVRPWIIEPNEGKARVKLNAAHKLPDVDKLVWVKVSSTRLPPLGGLNAAHWPDAGQTPLVASRLAKLKIVDDQRTFLKVVSQRLLLEDQQSMLETASAKKGDGRSFRSKPDFVRPGEKSNPLSNVGSFSGTAFVKGVGQNVIHPDLVMMFNEADDRKIVAYFEKTNPSRSRKPPPPTPLQKAVAPIVGQILRMAGTLEQASDLLDSYASLEDADQALPLDIARAGHCAKALRDLSEDVPETFMQFAASFGAQIRVLHSPKGPEEIEHMCRKAWNFGVHAFSNPGVMDELVAEALASGNPVTETEIDREMGEVHMEGRASDPRCDLSREKVGALCAWRAQGMKTADLSSILFEDPELVGEEMLSILGPFLRGCELASEAWVKLYRIVQVGLSRKKIALLEKEKNALQAQVDEGHPGVGSNSAEIEAENEELKRKLLESNKTVDRLQAKLLIKDRAQVTSNEQIATKDQDLEALRSALSDNSAESDTLADKLSTKDAEVKKLNGDLSTTKTDVEELTLSLSTKTTQVQELTDEVSTRTTQAEELAEEVSAQTAQVKELADQIDARDSEVARYRDTIENLEETLSDKSTKYRSLKRKFAEFQGGISPLSPEL